MALYALGDMHLAFSVDKPMDRFGKVWKKHEEKLEKNCRKLIGNEDTFVITGDHCWGKNLSEAKTDLAFIADLPGNKILLRGNHDMFWDAKKTAVLNQEYEPQLHFLQNNHYHYQDYALVGTKGYTFEGPFYINSKGQIVGWDEANEKQAKKLVAREAERLRISLKAPERPASVNILCFSTIRQQISWKRRVSSRGWPKSTEWSMLYIPTATESPVTATVSTEFTMGSGITWFLETTSILSLKRSWIRSSTGTVE